MGWWTQDEQGVSFTDARTEMLWGDPVADLMDDLVSAFTVEQGRPPTEAEVLAGFRFSTEAAVERRAAPLAAERSQVAEAITLLRAAREGVDGYGAWKEADVLHDVVNRFEGEVGEILASAERDEDARDHRETEPGSDALEDISHKTAP